MFGLVGACSTFTFFQSTQSSSARIIGRAVMIPWPISDLPRVSVTRLSEVMRTHASKGLGVFFSCSAAWPAKARVDKRNPTTSAAPPVTPVLRNSRREKAELFAIRHPGKFREQFGEKKGWSVELGLAGLQ